MNNIKSKRNFLDLFNNNISKLKVKFNIHTDEIPTEVIIENTLGKKTNIDDLLNLSKICSDQKLKDFIDFYSKHDGFNLATPTHPKNAVNKPLLRQLSASGIIKYTNQYLPGGQWAWTIDLNKTKPLYRGETKWIVFAVFDDGPACLTTFLNGENAGCIFLLSPQPHFNILKPISKTYAELLDRIAKDPVSFFKLTRAYVTLVGKDKQNFGYVPLEYID